MAQISWWVFPLNIAAGALLGFLIAEYRDWKRMNKERVGHLEALAAEIQICAEMAGGYLRGNVRAPSYRMPLIAYERSLPALLADGVLSFSETTALIRFYVNAQAFNYSVEHAQQVLMMKDENRPPKRLDLEAKRAATKAKKLVKGGERPNHYDGAIAVVRNRLPKDSQGRLSLAEEDMEEVSEDP